MSPFVFHCIDSIISLVLVTKQAEHEDRLPQNEAHLVQIRQMSLVVRKPAFCICENKDANQLRGNREADQRLCFRYIDSTIHLLPKPEISSL